MHTREELIMAIVEGEAHHISTFARHISDKPPKKKKWHNVKSLGPATVIDGPYSSWGAGSSGRRHPSREAFPPNRRDTRVARVTEPTSPADAYQGLDNYVRSTKMELHRHRQDVEPNMSTPMRGGGSRGTIRPDVDVNQELPVRAQRTIQRFSGRKTFRPSRSWKEHRKLSQRFESKEDLIEAIINEVRSGKSFSKQMKKGIRKWNRLTPHEKVTRRTKQLKFGHDFAGQRSYANYDFAKGVGKPTRRKAIFDKTTQGYVKYPRRK